MEKFLKSLFFALFPFAESFFKNKKVGVLIDNLENKDFEQNKNFMELKTEYEISYKRKDKFEDKAKSNIISVTIAITLIMGSLTIIKEFMKSYNFSCFNIIAIGLFVFAVIYMISAGLSAFSSLMDKNIVYLSRLNESDLEEIEQAVTGNNYYNTIRNNLVTTSYRCIRNALICMFFVMLILIASQFEFTKNDKIVALPQTNTGVYYSSEVINNDWFFEMKPKIESFIQNSIIVIELDTGIETGVIDLDNELFIKLVKNVDNSIHVILIEQFKSE
ncbi:hypothetical protein IZU99_10585 [Oscillospiraceae bacterium CM]|nr:hypothetical protein IZU99_10585 [Oscillospiraceae bacterium CM]